MRQCLVLFRRGDGRLPFVLRNAIVVLLHRGLARRQLLLNLYPLIAALTRKIHDGIIQLILIETKLGLRNFKFAVLRSIRRRSATCCQRRDPRLIALYSSLKLRHSLLQCQGLAGQLRLIQTRLP